MRWWLILVAGAAATAGAAALYFMRSPREVATALPRRGDAVEVVYATGFVEPEHPVSLSARITAPVVAVRADEGEVVHRGEVLVLLDDAEQRSLLRQVEAQRIGAEQKERRVVDLYGKGWMTRAARDEAVAAASASRASERAAGARAANSVIRAPFDGIILKRDVEPGDLAVPGAALIQLGNPAETRITATVDERDILALAAGNSVLLSADALGQRVLQGTVSSITPGGDPTQRAFRVRIHLTEARSLPIGMTLEANIVTRRHQRALLVPAKAVANHAVWIVDADGRARQQKVRTGIEGPDSIEILAGLSPRSRLILDPPESLREGARVRIGR